MPDQNLLDSINKELALGVDKQKIIKGLLAQKWQQAQIDEAFTFLSAQTSYKQTNQPKSAPNQNYLPGPKEILSQAWQIYKERWKTVVVIMLIPILPIGLALIGITILYQSITNLQNFLLPMILIAIGIGLAILFNLWYPVALLFAVRDRNEKIGFKVSFGRSRGKILGYTILSILTAVIIIFGFILFIIPGVIFLVWFSMATFILVSENVGPIEALKRSRQYVKGKGFEVLYRIIAISVFIQIASVVVLLIPVINLLAFFIISYVLGPLSIISGFVLYENLKNLNGKSISNPVSKVFVILIVFVIGIIALSGFIFASYFISNLIKNTQKPAARINQDVIYPTTSPTLGPTSPQLNISISPIATPSSSIPQASESSSPIQ